MPAENPHHPSRPFQPALRAAFGVVLSLAAVVGAQAQAVRKCQIDGRLVFQSAPCAQERGLAAPLAAPVSAAISTSTSATSTTSTTTRPAVGEAPRKRTLAELLRERERDGATRPPIREAQNDGAAVLRPRMGAV